MGRVSASAPRNVRICFSKSSTTAENIAPTTPAEKTTRVKMRFASSLSPSPILWAERVLAPIEKRCENPISRELMGAMILMDASAVGPT